MSRVDQARIIAAKLKAQRQSINEVIPQLLSRTVTAANGDAAKGREIATIAAQAAGIMQALDWSSGMTTQPGDFVNDPKKEYVYMYTGKAAMTHSNPTYYPGAAGVYYWSILPKTHNGIKVYPNVAGIIVATKKDERWWNVNKSALYKYVGVDNPNCAQPPIDGITAIWQREVQ